MKAGQVFIGVLGALLVFSGLTFLFERHMENQARMRQVEQMDEEMDETIRLLEEETKKLLKGTEKKR